MKNVLIVLETGGRSPQDKVRGKLLENLFRKYGIKIKFVGRRLGTPKFLSNSSSFYLNEFQNSLVFLIPWKILDTFLLKLKERRILLLAKKSDVVQLIKVNSLNLIVNLKKDTNCRVVYDLADGLWLKSHQHIYPDINKILKSVDAITCDNQITYNYAKNFNNSVFLYPSPSQVEMFDNLRSKKEKFPDRKKIIIGWIGSPSTVFHLYSIWEPMEHLFEKYKNIHFRIVGVGNRRSFLPPFENVEYSVCPYYSTEKMIQEVLNMDIGIFPLFDINDAKIRGVLKIEIYMSGEAAVISSPYGTIPSIIKDGVNGFLAKDHDEWYSKLEKLIVDDKLRKRLSLSGLVTVRENFSLEKCFEFLLKALDIEK